MVGFLLCKMIIIFYLFPVKTRWSILYCPVSQLVF